MSALEGVVLVTSGLRGVTLLVIEDSASIAELLRLSLSEDGAVVVQAMNGNDALRQLDEGLRPDALILDMLLPDMNGADLLSALMARGMQFPCLLLSGWPEAHRIAQEMGVAFLRKPFDLDELLGKVALLVADARVSQ
jgi:two-component system OmpR family response regulator